jgi:hypothetical protein
MKEEANEEIAIPDLGCCATSGLPVGRPAGTNLYMRRLPGFDPKLVTCVSVMASLALSMFSSRLTTSVVQAATMKPSATARAHALASGSLRGEQGRHFDVHAMDELFVAEPGLVDRLEMKERGAAIERPQALPMNPVALVTATSAMI